MKVICIDAGNTFIKVAFVEQGGVLSVVSFALADSGRLLPYLAAMPQADACILSSVSIVAPAPVDFISKLTPRFFELTADTPVPVHNLYKTPETLGKDRLASVVGAYSLYPGKSALVVDAGTALTFDFIDRRGNYLGGNISPGMRMRFQALHDYTKRLPLEGQSNDFQLIGSSTSSAIVAGVQNGIIFEIEGYIKRLVRQYPDLVTIITGGDVNFFADKFESPIFAEPNLIIIGLEEIIEFNIDKLG